MAMFSTAFTAVTMSNKDKIKYLKRYINLDREIEHKLREIDHWRAKLQAYLGQHVPEKKYTSAVRLITKWCFPITGKHRDGEYKTTRPDTDNLQKLLKDVMTDLGYWTDDALVASEIIEKFWAKIPGVYICIEEVK